MRLDQFLSLSRLIKRRTQAKLACERGLVYVDGDRAKPAKEIKEGQKLLLDLARKRLEIEILKLPSKGLSKNQAKELYSIISEDGKEDRFLE